MKVIFGGYIEMIIDPQMDLGETVRIVFAPMYKACCFDFSAAPSLPAIGDRVCVLWLSSPLKIMILRWVQASLIDQTIKKRHYPTLESQKQVHYLQVWYLFPVG